MVKFFKSDRKGKKYMVVYDGKKIHFGDSNMQQYKDSTGLGLYSHLDHNDNERRRLYRTRASKITNKEGKLTYNNPSSSNYYSYWYLW